MTFLLSKIAEDCQSSLWTSIFWCLAGHANEVNKEVNQENAPVPSRARQILILERECLQSTELAQVQDSELPATGPLDQSWLHHR